MKFTAVFKDPAAFDELEVCSRFQAEGDWDELDETTKLKVREGGDEFGFEWIRARQEKLMQQVREMSKSHISLGEYCSVEFDTETNAVKLAPR